MTWFPYSPAFLDKLRRFDRRLWIEPQPGKAGLHRIGYDDAFGDRHYVLEDLDDPLSSGRIVFLKLHRAAPWKVNQAYRQWLAERIERPEEAAKEARRHLPVSLHEEAHRAWTFYENNPRAVRRRTELVNKQRQALADAYRR